MNDHHVAKDQGRCGVAPGRHASLEVGHQIRFPADRSVLQVEAIQLAGCAEGVDKPVEHGRRRSRSVSVGQASLRSAQNRIARPADVAVQCASWQTMRSISAGVTCRSASNTRLPATITPAYPPPTGFRQRSVTQQASVWKAWGRSNCRRHVGRASAASPRREKPRGLRRCPRQKRLASAGPDGVARCSRKEPHRYSVWKAISSVESSGVPKAWTRFPVREGCTKPSKMCR